jgi:hypothetical protein
MAGVSESLMPRLWQTISARDVLPVFEVAIRVVATLIVEREDQTPLVADRGSA